MPAPLKATKLNKELMLFLGKFFKNYESLLPKIEYNKGMIINVVVGK